MLTWKVNYNTWLLTDSHQIIELNDYDNDSVVIFDYLFCMIFDTWFWML